MTIDIPSSSDIVDLSEHRATSSVSIYLASGTGTERQPFSVDSEAARLALRSAATSAMAELRELGVDRQERDAIEEAVRALDRDRELWSTQARSLAVFLAPGVVRTFRLMNELPSHTAVGDRFDIGPLLRATSFEHSGYVLAITEGDVRLVFLGPDASSEEKALPALPDDVAENLERTTTGGRFDRVRAQGALGPKIEQRTYASAVQDAVLDVIGDSRLPLVLCAAHDLEPAYREVNTYSGLLEHGIDANPSSLSTQELESRARGILEQHRDDELAAWRERFGTLRADGRASAQLSDIARAAASGLVDTLLFDLESTDEGTIDEWGAITLADAPGPTTYGLLDELAARVLRGGGTVKAVRRADLPDGSQAAATFRAAL
ncbi:hypothetical protein [Agrococcus sp. ProA11]|uniref:baeRF11 domain-containing protein n=1 Tax=Agrococcus chionoecetis TaxID=3153752 RepID=UPI0032619BFB